jgi:RNA polymerase subunit RPABC4/transcription elongation factor Spt4
MFRQRVRREMITEKCKECIEQKQNRCFTCTMEQTDENCGLFIVKDENPELLKEGELI